MMSANRLTLVEREICSFNSPGDPDAVLLPWNQRHMRPLPRHGIRVDYGDVEPANGSEIRHTSSYPPVAVHARP